MMMTVMIRREISERDGCVPDPSEKLCRANGCVTYNPAQNSDVNRNFYCVRVNSHLRFFRRELLRKPLAK